MASLKINPQNLWLLVSAVLAVIAIALVSLLLLGVGWQVHSNCNAIEDLKSRLRETLIVSRDSSLSRPDLDQSTKDAIQDYYRVEIARYAASDCGI